MTEREQQILALIRQNPLIPQQELAERLGISRSAVAGHIMHLTQKGIIEGKGYILAPQSYAVVIGGANMDLCGVADAQLTPEDSSPGNLSVSAGGVGRNIAENLARLGSDVELLSLFGDDAWGAQLKQACRQANVGIEHCRTYTETRSCSYLSLNHNDGELALALNDMALMTRLDEQQIEQWWPVINRSQVVVIDANVPEPGLAALFARPLTQPFLVDPVSLVKAERIKPYLNQIDMLKPNLKEAELLSGQTITGESDLPKVANKLHQLGVDRVFISLGAGGGYGSESGQGRRLRSEPEHVVNVNGAGDALMAALVHGRMQGWSFFDTLDFADEAARVATRVSTTINPAMSEVTVRRAMEYRNE